MERVYRLVISCPDCVGIVARVSGFISDCGGWLTEASYHADREAGWFFMRTEIRADSLSMSLEAFRERFARDVANHYGMHWFVHDSAERPRLVLMASKASHCLADLLYRWSVGELECDIACVIANHPDHESLVQHYGLPYHCVSFGQGREEAFAEINALLERYAADVVVLARFMQVIPPAMCQQWAGRMINIHHSFLPSFAGAQPYHQAHARGVKLIGATCHYVTEDLDAGPIIEQDVARVNHRHDSDDLVRLGRDVEKAVLARGLIAHLEDRVIIHGNKTVILD
ncbi:MAG: formyltetrahydrofolate deformylase [Gammaproteobacteria bacterium]|nr:MAG: formyltetrahydrofolate deformylase [Gammaproteobacteria bacterium]